jgi:aspartyl-tRNA(Asn)/glutamyl-tRNA(Gln) amidotransferase subunit A
MTIEQWLEDAKSDAYRRKLPVLADLLDGLARSTAALREADWNDEAETQGTGAHAAPVALAPGVPGAPIAPVSAPVPVPPAAPTIAELAPELARGAIKAERLAEDALAAIAAQNPRLNAFITVTADQALGAARAADQEIAAGRYRGALHGIPISLKDLIDLAGVPTTGGSRLREGRMAATDAPVTRHVLDAGAVVVGKTNLHEFAFGTTTEDSGWGPARNPFDDSRSPGGSSGGSAIAVRTGMSIASIGTDTGGSIRIPAAACGIVGLKPAWGEVSAEGVLPLSRQLDHVGPLARSVTDAALLFDVLRGVQAGTLDVSTPPSPNGIRLAVLGGYFFERLSADVDAAIRGAIDVVGRAGATLIAASLPHANGIAPVYLHLVLADAAAYHVRSLERRPHAYTESVRLRLEMGRSVLGEDYVRAERGKALIRDEVNRALDGVDALVLPALSIEAPPIGAATVPVIGGDEPVRAAMLRCTQPFNLSGHPAISVPCGLTRAGLPVGLQIVGHHGRTVDLVRVALMVERALDGQR